MLNQRQKPKKYRRGTRITKIEQILELARDYDYVVYFHESTERMQLLDAVTLTAQKKHFLVGWIRLGYLYYCHEI